MRVFFNSQEVIEGRTAAVKQAIRRRKKDDPHLKYKFSDPFSELECALYDLRTGFMNWFWDNYPYEIQEEAISIETRRAHDESIRYST